MHAQTSKHLQRNEEEDEDDDMGMGGPIALEVEDPQQHRSLRIYQMLNQFSDAQLQLSCG